MACRGQYDPQTSLSENSFSWLCQVSTFQSMCTNKHEHPAYLQTIAFYRIQSQRANRGCGPFWPLHVYSDRWNHTYAIGLTMVLFFWLVWHYVLWTLLGISLLGLLIGNVSNRLHHDRSWDDNDREVKKWLTLFNNDNYYVQTSVLRWG